MANFDDNGLISIHTHRDYDTRQRVVELSVSFRVRQTVSDEVLLASSYAEHEAMMQTLLEIEREALIRSVEEWVAKCRSSAQAVITS